MTATIEYPRVVSRSEWLAARTALLEREKQLTRERDDLARRRRELPWVKVDKDYRFEGAEGPVSLGDLFAGRSQLIVYHFMYTPGWEHGCPSCSFGSDHFDAALPHLAARDVTLVAVSRAPYADFAPFKRRMGWRFNWVSASGSEFSFDYHASFTPELVASGTAAYNFMPIPENAMLGLMDLPGISVFYRNEEGEIFHTYSCYARGIEPVIGTYSWLDLVPKGRDEDGLAYPMAWVRHHDRYDESYAVDPKAGYPMPPTRNG